MSRAAVIGLCLLACTAQAQAKDLKGVFEDAVKNDPVIRGADANRLAAREARPQAWSAILPQVNGTAGVTWDHNGGYQDQVAEVGNPNDPTAPPILQVVPLPETIDQRTRSWALNLRSEPDLLDQLDEHQGRRCPGGAGGGQLPGRRAEPDPARGPGLLQRAGRLRRTGGQPGIPRSHLAPARPGQHALRCRSHRHHRRAGGQGLARHGRRRRDRRQAHARHLAVPAAGDHRRAVRAARQARRRHAAQGARSPGREPLGQHFPGAEPEPDLQPPRRRHRP